MYLFLRYELYRKHILYSNNFFYYKLEISLGSANGVLNGELDADSNIRR